MIRIDAPPTDGFFVAQQLATIAKGYDAVFCGRESLDYNGGMGVARDIIEQVLRAQGKWLKSAKAFGW